MAVDHSNQAGYQTLIWTMVTTLLFMFYIALIHPGVALDQNQPAAESSQEQK